jgi:hypothetical protein
MDIPSNPSQFYQLVGYLIAVSIGLGVALVIALDARETYERLMRRGLNGGFIILARSNVWGSISRCILNVLLLIAGLFALFGVPNVYWPLLVMAGLLAFNALYFRFERRQAADVEIERVDDARYKQALAASPSLSKDRT